MQRYAVPLIKRYRKTAGTIKPLSKNLQEVLLDESNDPLGTNKSVALSEYFLNKNSPRLEFHERRYLLYFLNRHREYPSLIKFGNKFLFNDNPTDLDKFRDNVTKKELSWFLQSLIKTKRFTQLDLVMCKIISQYSLTRKSTVLALVATTFENLVEVSNSDPSLPNTEALLKWAKWIKLINGSCELTNYMSATAILRPILEYIQAIKDTEDLIDILQTINKILGAATCSQTATTLLYLAQYNRDFSMVEKLWHYKVQNDFPITSSDLSGIMRVSNYNNEFVQLRELYGKYPHAHRDSTQFDYLLLAHAKTANWRALKEQFEGLFEIGRLPNARHYEIVMYSMAHLGELANVEKLYSQFLRRGMIPTYSILQSLLYAHYKVNDLAGCFEQFQLFERNSIAPTEATYSLMFKVYKGLNNIEGALRLLKKITDEKSVNITEEHLSILIEMCSKFTNHLVAKEIFHIMTDFYKIKPTSLSISALMKVLNESELYSDALHLFKKYTKIEKIEDQWIVSLYNAAITANMKMGRKEQCETLFNEVLEKKYRTNSEFYKIFIQYMVCSKKDFEGAKKLIHKLLNKPDFKANASHFEFLIREYDKSSYYDGVFEVYEMMAKNKIAVNSQILHYIIKATFKVQMKRKEDLDRSIELVDGIMEKAAEGTLNMVGNKFHPSIMAWAMRTVAKFYDPKKALEILNRYNNLFYGKDYLSVAHKFVLMRSLSVLFAEIGEWEDFNVLFDNIIKQIEQYEKLPSTTVQNKKLRSLFIGIFPYKIQHLKLTNQIQTLPSLLKTLETKGFVLDNESWNETLKALFSDVNTIEKGLKIANDTMIHGYNLIHKYRLLKRLNGELATKKMSWLLKMKKQDPSSFQPSLYIHSSVYLHITKSLDMYLNEVGHLEDVIKVYIEKFPYFMKSYLMSPRIGITDWQDIERRHLEYFKKMRTQKRIIEASEF
ncbi:hypothetical protein KAFR_0D00920 [Kazachstania africana CBS 2517]|uniref:Pentacotripeptide-repeat region of PRORP domain-containing protein n=1 Tax=Kazachstania africana (strain ATCC 22294 / BCRC 22015 / CBS 2517 / CECT 1963 / NBRC 1671 / NRRL Y-8276) TaxID=1071382 RepID=H2ATN9_KAZAF|nr:hypothetical protein KAFR_0D00920 [Kazachstania africana CBS 2517]CCF57739.1 hypothetical protein KAFR_0D00920 [Kazachstania africana CBS 2517]